MKAYLVKNLGNGVITVLETESDFINFAIEAYKDNESDAVYPNEAIFEPENISNAVEYISEWCENLNLIIIESE